MPSQSLFPFQLKETWKAQGMLQDPKMGQKNRIPIKDKPNCVNRPRAFCSCVIAVKQILIDDFSIFK